MTKEELAEQYVAEQTTEFQEAIRKAFLQGYEQGAKTTPTSVKIDGVKYVDFGLPSGTLWAAPIAVQHGYGHKYEMCTYAEASKLNIPTSEQVEELIQYTKVTPINHHYVEIIGVNGARLKVYVESYESINWGYKNPENYRGEGIDYDANLFWMQSDISDGKALATQIDYEGNMCTVYHYAGYKLPIFLVKQPE